MNVTQRTRVLGLVALLASNVALSHGNTKPLHGGVVQLVGEMSFELVTTPDGAELYVFDDGEAIVSQRMTAMLMIDIDGFKSEVVMLPAGGNKFAVKDEKIRPGARIVVMLIAPDQSRTTARFTIK